MYRKISFLLFFCLLFFASSSKAQGGIIRALERAAEASSVAEHAAQAAKAAELAEHAATGARLTEEAVVAYNAVKAAKVVTSAKKLAFTFAESTTEIASMKIYVATKENGLLLRSNYVPPGWRSTVDLTTGLDKMQNGKTLVKYLTYGDDYIKPSPLFDQAFKNNIDILIHPSFFEHGAFHNVDWSGTQHLFVFDGEHSYTIRPLVNKKKETEVLAKLDKNVYTRIIPEDVCTGIDYAGRLYDAFEFIATSDDIELEPGDIQTNIKNPSILKAVENGTAGSIIKELTSSGFTLVDATCTTEDKIEKYVFEVYKEPTNTEAFLKVTDKLGEIYMKAKPQEKKKEEKGLGIGWWILIVVVVLFVIGSLSKD